MKFDVTAHIDLHLHHGDVAGMEKVLHSLGEILRELKKGNGIMAAVRQDIVDFAAKVDTATTAIAARIQKLIDNSTGLSAEEKAELTRLADGLTVMGKDPADPVPPVPVA